MEEPLITQADDTLSGIPVFYGTRVPIQTLLDYLSSGETIEAFLSDFPSVRRDQVLKFLETATLLAIAHAHENPD
jgi:uncharacterized protein (DUF433 family)